MKLAFEHIFQMVFEVNHQAILLFYNIQSDHHLLISLYLEESVDYVSIRNQINDKDNYILNLVKIII